jgi:DNA-binding response OmpR family regulator
MTRPLTPPWKVLIVDDDPTVHKLITKKLSSEAYQVQSVFDAPSALSEVDRVKPDLVILDLMMPRTSGIEVCKAIKENQKTRDVMVLILSAKESQDDRIRGLQLGADDYISKPFHLAALTRKIEYMLAKKNSITEP